MIAGSLLARIGLLDEDPLPITGAVQVDKVLDKDPPTRCCGAERCVGA